MKGFNLQLVLTDGNSKIKITPVENFKSIKLKNNQSALFNKAGIEQLYYVTATPVEQPKSAAR